MKLLVPLIVTGLGCAAGNKAMLAPTAAAAQAGSDVEAGGEYVRPTMILPFIEDDYELALKTAKEKKLPIFVDAWVSW